MKYVLLFSLVFATYAAQAGGPYDLGTETRESLREFNTQEALILQNVLSKRLESKNYSFYDQHYTSLINDIDGEVVDPAKTLAIYALGTAINKLTTHHIIGKYISDVGEENAADIKTMSYSDALSKIYKYYSRIIQEKTEDFQRKRFVMSEELTNEKVQEITALQNELTTSQPLASSSYSFIYLKPVLTKKIAHALFIDNTDSGVTLNENNQLIIFDKEKAVATAKATITDALSIMARNRSFYETYTIVEEHQSHKKLLNKLVFEEMLKLSESDYQCNCPKTTQIDEKGLQAGDLKSVDLKDTTTAPAEETAEETEEPKEDTFWNFFR